jgi:hypothetical protein
MSLAVAGARPLERLDLNPPLSTTRTWLRAAEDWVIPLSLANLSLVRIWSQLLYTKPGDSFVMKNPPEAVEYYAAVASLFGVAAFLWVANLLLLKVQGSQRLIRCLRFLPVLVVINGFREVVSSNLPLPLLRFKLYAEIGASGLWAAGTVGSCIALWALSKWYSRFRRAMRIGSLIFMGLIPLTAGSALWRAARIDMRPFESLPSRGLTSPARAGLRVVWIVFDEWDQRLTFEDRAPGLGLPEIDSFRRESLYAARAYPPGSQTAQSIPALLSGRFVVSVQPKSANQLAVTYAGAPGAVIWGQDRTVFSDARAAGYNTAVAGWYLPYCRVFGNQLNACAWQEMSGQYNSMGEHFGQITATQIRSLFETNLLSVFGQSAATAAHARRYFEDLDQAKRFAADPRLDLVFLHLPPTHVPYFYDRRTGASTLKNSLVAGYVDALALTDRTLGQLRMAMQASGVWETTAVLVSSDHPMRESKSLDGKSDARVPLLLRVGGKAQGVTTNNGFNTIVSGELVFALMRGELTSTPAAAEWISRHAGNTSPPPLVMGPRR